MDDKEESAYERGQHAAARAMLGEVLRLLPDDERDAAAWRKEWFDIDRALRTLYRDASGKIAPWPDDAHLVDVIEKYIAPLIPDA